MGFGTGFTLGVGVAFGELAIERLISSGLGIPGVGVGLTEEPIPRLIGLGIPGVGVRTGIGDGIAAAVGWASASTDCSIQEKTNDEHPRANNSAIRILNFIRMILAEKVFRLNRCFSRRPNHRVSLFG